MKQKQINKTIWKEIPLGELLDYEQPTKYIVESTNYNNDFKTPVLTAGKSFILGYTNETEGIFENLPAIIFDDFTTANKFVDFKFKVKSSAMKILRPKNKFVDLRYVYFMIQGIKLNFETHKRYYLSIYQHKKIPMPFTAEGKLDLEKQKQVLLILERAENLKQKKEEVIKLLDESAKAIFYDMFLKEGKFEKVPLNDIAKLSMGGTPLTTEPTYWEEGHIPWMKSGDIKGDYIFKVLNKITELGFKKSNTTLFPKGTVVIALNGQGRTRGTTAILKIETTSNQSVIGIIIDKNKILSEYLHFNLRMRYNELRGLTGDNERSGLNLGILRAFKIPLPPMELQKKFSKIIEQIEKLKERQNQSREEALRLFDVLIQKAFVGELI